MSLTSYRAAPPATRDAHHAGRSSLTQRYFADDGFVPEAQFLHQRFVMARRLHDFGNEAGRKISSDGKFIWSCPAGFSTKVRKYD